MPTTDITGATALVTGASRGFGRGIATSLGKAGAEVVGVARDHDQLLRLREELGDSFIPVTADATAPATAGQLIDAYRPAILVLNAGATPLARPLQHHTWQTFSQNWDVDVQHVFRWVREALLAPLDPGSTVIPLRAPAANPRHLAWRSSRQGICRPAGRGSRRLPEGSRADAHHRAGRRGHYQPDHRPWP